MGQIGAIFLVVAIVVILLVIRPAKRKNDIQELMREGGLQPYFTYQGDAFVSKQEASDKGGDYGLKCGLGLFRDTDFVRLSLYYKKKWRTYDIDYGGIGSVERIVLHAGEHGEYTVHLIAMTFDADTFPLRELYLYPGDYELLDELRDVLRPKKVAAS